MKKEISNNILSFIWFFVKKYKLSFSAFVIAVLVLSDIAYFFLSPFLLKLFVDGLSNNTLDIYRGIVLILAIGFGDLWYPFGILIRYLSFNSLSRATEDIRTKMFTYSLRQSTSFFNDNYSGNLTGKINIILNKFNETITTFLYIFRNFLLLFVLIFIMFSINKFFGILMIFWFLSFACLTYYWSIKISQKAELSQEIQGDINGLIVDDFVNIQNIKVFSSIAIERKKLSSAIRKKIRAIFDMNRYLSISNFMIFVLNYMIIVVIMVISAKMMLDGKMVIGTFFFILEMCRKVCTYSQYFGSDTNEAFKNIAIMRNGLQVISNDIEIKDKKNAGKIKVNDGKIVFNNIKFSYEK